MLMANPRERRSRPPEDAAGTGMSRSARASREQADGADAAQEREVPVTAGSEMAQQTSSTAPSMDATPAVAPQAAEAAPSRASQLPAVAERVETTFGRWGERLGGGMASARRMAREKTRALTAPGMQHGAEGGAHPSDSAAHPTHPAERWPDSPTLQRAEEVVNRMSGRVRPLASVIGQRVQRLFARAREEAEDIWAEAESMRARGAGHAGQGSRMAKG